MVARDPEEEHRPATPLELFFDLCFVAAVAQISGELHHYVADDLAAHALPGYLAVFFAIWWAWMNFTWFASAYDTDDVPYRIATFGVITGALILAAGVTKAFEQHDYLIITLGYTVMRVALISLWLRAARSHPEGRTTALRYALGLVVVQAAWLCWLLVPPGLQLPLFAAFAVCDLAVPVWAEHLRRTPFHPHHIAERYGLFTLIVLGESVLGATTAVRSAVDANQATWHLYAVAAGGLLTVFAMWWLYFARPAAPLLVSLRVAFVWGYGHYLIFGSAAAVGAGLAINVDQVTHHAAIDRVPAAAAVTLPVALFLLTLWLLHVRPHQVNPGHSALFPGTALLVLATTLAPAPVLVTGLLLTALVAAGLLAGPRAPRASG
ncbi:low temperature requirement protein A [Streptomyces hainanensis]|uniref:Low temperature requirement protein A n=2 Tax=Streptomyces hainanensis TaxID=402648 RepID=A0A4R4TQN4_9ACTN|nr:low temperature requirement protein A [Streptomyces hainanensis]